MKSYGVTVQVKLLQWCYLLVVVLRYLSWWSNCSDVTIQMKILHRYSHMVLHGLLLSVLEDVTWDFCFASLRVKLRSI